MESREAPQAESMDDGGVFFVSLHFKGSAFDVPVQTGDPLSTIFDFVQEALDFPRETCRLIHRGKQLRPSDEIQAGDAGLRPGTKLMLMASSAQDVAFVQNSRADPLVKGFEEEDRDERARKRRAKAGNASAWGTKQDPEYRFGSIKAEFKYHTPTPYDAERLLEKLATDPGIIDIMKTHSFKVGILTEMSPKESKERMANKGQPDMDLLGYNQNHGDMIVLKLRTDNTKGFRPYHDLINTLVHEITHNVWGPHDHNFWKLFGELKAQYMRFHRFWSHGGHTAEGGAGGQQFGGFAGDDEAELAPASGFGNVLGGAEDGSALRAAEKRAQAADTPFIRSEFFGFKCPCGLVHEEEFLCEPIGGGASVDGLDKAAPLEGQAVAKEPAVALAADSGDSGAEQAKEEPVAIEPTVDPGPAQAERSQPEPQPTQPAPSASSAPAADSAFYGDTADNPSAEDLAAMGLDSAAVWVERFSSQLRSLRLQPAAMQMLLRLTQNVADSPYEAKFRRIRAENPKISSTLLSAGPGVAVLLALLGFEAATEDGQRVFVLRDAVLDPVRLRLGKELLEQQAVITASAA